MLVRRVPKFARLSTEDEEALEADGAAMDENALPVPRPPRRASVQHRATKPRLSWLGGPAEKRDRFAAVAARPLPTTAPPSLSYAAVLPAPLAPAAPPPAAALRPPREIGTASCEMAGGGAPTPMPTPPVLEPPPPPLPPPLASPSDCERRGKGGGGTRVEALLLLTPAPKLGEAAPPRKSTSFGLLTICLSCCICAYCEGGCCCCCWICGCCGGGCCCCSCL